jgi:hypothetical protein
MNYRFQPNMYSTLCNGLHMTYGTPMPNSDMHDIQYFQEEGGVISPFQPVSGN